MESGRECLDGRITMPELRQEIGARIRTWRRDRKLTQAALAARSGLSRDMIGFIERGRAAPSLAALERISSALGVSMVVLFGGRDDPSIADGAAHSILDRILNLFDHLEDEQQIVAENVIKALLGR